MDGQLLLALVIVALAVAFLAREGWRRARRPEAPGCGGCASQGGCAPQGAWGPKPLTGPGPAGLKRLPTISGRGSRRSRTGT